MKALPVPREDRAPGRRRRAPLPVAVRPDAAGRRRDDRARGPRGGVLCPDGHFTDPDRPACRTCGTPLHDAGRRVCRPRPPLGLLVTDGGTIYPVTGDVVIGREPSRRRTCSRAGPDRCLCATRRGAPPGCTPGSTVSGWKVLLSDDASANGTFVSRHGAAGPWLPVMPGAPMPLLHGDRVRLGKRQLLFDSWRETVVPQLSR